MISCPTVKKAEIQNHYDVATLFYWLLWGRHLHHGLWEGSESPQVAQQQLTETVARLAGIEHGERVLDVGCGMGGSSIHLSRRHQCQVTGITLSPVQRHWATMSARWNRAARNTDFRRADAEQVEFPAGTFDVVWSIECTEHLFDKPRFFERAAGWLKPGGRMAICAWLAADEPADAAAEKQVYDVCEGFLCPSLGSMADYAGWMRAAGLTVEHELDWTDRVAQTWEICMRRVERSRIRWLTGPLRPLDRNMKLFLDRFETILQAYRSGAMRYGCLVAHKRS